jgi:hypothetical protein
VVSGPAIPASTDDRADADEASVVTELERRVFSTAEITSSGAPASLTADSLTAPVEVDGVVTVREVGDRVRNWARGAMSTVRDECGFLEKDLDGL